MQLLLLLLQINLRISLNSSKHFSPLRVATQKQNNSEDKRSKIEKSKPQARLNMWLDQKLVEKSNHNNNNNRWHWTISIKMNNLLSLKNNNGGYSPKNDHLLTLNNIYFAFISPLNFLNMIIRIVSFDFVLLLSNKL